jgi:signal transduction histidine kinase
MDPERLIIHNLGFILNAVLLAFLIGLVYVKGRQQRGASLFIFGFLSIFIWVVSHVIGVNIADPELSRFVLMFHISILFISCFIAHFIFVFTGKEKENRGITTFYYTLSIFLALVYIVFPDTLITDSIPKLYFPNYYVAGNLHWAMTLLSNIIIPAHFLIHLARTYRTQTDIMKNRIKYVLTGFLFGYSFGGLGIPLVFSSNPTLFGIVIDPIYSILFVPLFTIPFTYAVLKYELIDIRIIAKRAFIYAALVAAVGLIIGLLVFSNELIRASFPNFPRWILPLVSAIATVTIAFFIWNKLRELDFLKYQFITVVTHKFRTPLTQIRWATEGFSPNTPDEDKDRIHQIQQANIHLLELTDLLAHVSQADMADVTFSLKPQKIDTLVEKLKAEYVRRSALKNIHMGFLGTSGADVLIDEGQTRFVLQTLFDNALSYTPSHGSIQVSVSDEKDPAGKIKNVLLSVADTGIGFSKEELGRLFEKFWRSTRAYTMDTEGMGIGLFMCKHIINHQHGTLWAESEGPGKGTTFHIKLPVGTHEQ